MPRYEYKVVPAPAKANKIKGLKGTDQRFAASLAEVMNALGAQGWEYQRTDTLPCEERQGLTGKTTRFQNVLVFRRELDGAPAAPATAQVTAPETMLAVPTFRATAPAAVPPEGAAPRLNGPEASSAG